MQTTLLTSGPSFRPAWSPIKVLPSPVVRPSPARHPTTTLLLPEVANSNARRPTATFSSPLVRALSAMLPRAVLAPSVAVVPLKAVSAPSPRATLNSRGCVVKERSGTNGRVKLASCVVPHGCSANSGQMPAGGVQEAHSKTNGQVEVGVVLVECLRPNCHVEVASCVAGKRPRTNGHVILTGSIGSKRIFTHGGIVDPGGERVQRVISHCCVSTCATRAWALCFERRRKRKPAERNCQCKKTATQWRAVDGSY